MAGTFAFTSLSAQTQNTADEKANSKPGSTYTPIPPAAQQQNNEVQDPALKQELPEINDAVINVKDEQQYLEQKKRAQEQNKSKSETENNTPK